ncbi:MAG TPA: HAD-IIIA family hydrolase [Verrucomicrobiae bacterium]|nr:HAD-IIIA family hydrolase [Verrucomicrobiae bacterium]
MGEHDVRKRRAVFLDRDGVLNRALVRGGVPFPPGTLEEFELEKGVIEGCARLKEAGFVLVVISNQPDVGRGSQRREIVETMHETLRAAIPALDAIEVCYHAGSKHGDPCDCRKPKPGMLLRAAVACDLDLTRSFVIGDRWRDIDCAHRAGCRAVLIERGYQEALRAKPEFTVANFAGAVATILGLAARNDLAEPFPRH